MRIVLFDSIMETHVVTSLARALKARGHDVATTGQLTRGHVPISEAADLRRVDSAIDDILAFRPDVVLVFRPTSLPHAQLRRIRKSGARLMAWFSDDPVLWGLSYGLVVDQYDVILHCGNATVLDFYERTHGRATGVNVPFWTDEVEFPRVGGSLAAESDLLFLGNVGDRIRRRRYFELGTLGLDLRIHGRTGDDYFSLSGGYLDTREEVLDAAARSRLAVSMPQVFADHRGTPTWFDGLDALGVFDTPSRIVQYAAMGLPVVSLQPDGSSPLGLPEVTVVRDPKALQETVRDLLSSPTRLEELADGLHRRFREHFSASSRAMAIESLAEDDSWRALDTQDRASWFMRFTSTEEPSGEGRPGEGLATVGPLSEGRMPATSAVRRVAVVGTGHGDYYSPLRIATRALAKAGHDVLEVTPAQLAAHSTSDPTGRFTHLVDLVSLDRSVEGADTYLFIGERDLPLPRSVRTLRDLRDVRVAVHALDATDHSERLAALVASVDAVSFLHRSAAEAFRGRETDAALHLPPLVDGDYRGLVDSLGLHAPPEARAVVVAEAEPDLVAHADLIEALQPMPVTTYVAESERGKRHGLAALARIAHSEIALVLGRNVGGAGPRLLPQLLAGGGVVVMHRSGGPAETAGDPQAWVLVGTGRELRQKLQRLASNYDASEALRIAARERARGQLGAEEGLERLLDLAHRDEVPEEPPPRRGDHATAPRLHPSPTPASQTTAGQE